MFTFKTIAWKLCKAAKTHILTSISIIAVAVCLIVTMTTYIYNAKADLDSKIDAMFGEMDILVGYDYGQGQFMSAQLLDDIARLPYIDAMSPITLEMTTVNGLSNIYTLGVENDALVKSRYHFNESITNDAVIISELLSKTVKATVGDTLTVNDKPYRIAEVLPTAQGAEPFNMAFVARHELQPTDGEALFALVKTNEVGIVAAQLHELDTKLRIDIVDDYDFIKMNIQSLLVFVVVLSVFVLLITALLLLSTLQLLMTKLKQQLMILRALGASIHQIARLIRIQLLSIVCIGVVLGALLSVVTIELALPKAIALLQLPAASTQLPLTWLCIIIVGLGGILALYMLLQVRKATNILPLQLAEETMLLEFKLSKWKGVLLAVVACIGLLLLLVGQLDQTGKGALQILLGAILLSLVSLSLIPHAFQWLLAIGLQPIRKLLGNEAYLACQQLIPQIRVHIKIVLTLVGMIVILVFGSSLLKSIQANEQAYIHERYEGQYLLKNTVMSVPIDAALVLELQALEGIELISATSTGNWIAYSEHDETYDLFAENLSYFGVEGETDDKLVITETFAKAHQLAVGDSLTPYFLETDHLQLERQGTYEVAKIIPAEQGYIGAYVDWSSPYAQKELSVYELTFNSDNLEALEPLLNRYPNLLLSTKAETIEQANVLFYQRWSMFIGIVAVLLVATTIGIIQTFMHVIYTNRAQYTLQRLLGLSPNGLIKYLCMQVLSFVLYGLITGLLVGMLLTRFIALIDKGSTITFDYVTISAVSGGLVVLLLVVFGMQGYMISRRKLVDEVGEME